MYIYIYIYIHLQIEPVQGKEHNNKKQTRRDVDHSNKNHCGCVHVWHGFHMDTVLNMMCLAQGSVSTWLIQVPMLNFKGVTPLRSFQLIVVCWHIICYTVWCRTFWIAPLHVSVSTRCQHPGLSRNWKGVRVGQYCPEGQWNINHVKMSLNLVGVALSLSLAIHNLHICNTNCIPFWLVHTSGFHSELKHCLRLA